MKHFGLVATALVCSSAVRRHRQAAATPGSCFGTNVPCNGNQCCPGIPETEMLPFPCSNADPDWTGCPGKAPPGTGPSPSPEPVPTTPAPSPPVPQPPATPRPTPQPVPPTPRPAPLPTPPTTPWPTFAPTPLDPNDDPNWGCGLLGAIPGINADGTATPETQRLIDGIKGSSTFGKTNYWNWNLVPDHGAGQYLTKDFIFIPEMWGQGVVDVNGLRPAGSSNFTLTREGSARSPATMSDLFMGSNEPDIIGSCMGGSFGSCLDPSCCWGPGVVATGVGFWPFPGCEKYQPLPSMWGDHFCIDSVMGHWQQTAAAALFRGYKYLTTPLVAWNISYAESFIREACRECQTIECGCPQYVGFHFYAYDCQPIALGGYDGFQARLNEVKDVMERYPFIKGAIVNEVGMLNCQSSYQNPICVPDNGRYPASQQPGGSCPITDELPNGMASYMDGLFDLFINFKTSDGREVVKAFSWFMLDKVGGTYNQQIFTDGKLNDLGEAYIRNCQRWEQAMKG